MFRRNFVNCSEIFEKFIGNSEYIDNIFTQYLNKF